MAKFKTLVENNAGWSMIILTFLGLAFPYGAMIPDATIIAMLATLIFLSCFKITEPLNAVVTWKPFVFCVLRYALLPIALGLVFNKILPSYALGVLLLALVPAGAASASIAGIYSGNVALALLITIISSMASVFLIPSVVGWLNHMTVAVNTTSLLKTLVLCILLPGAIYLAVRKKTAVAHFNQTWGRFTTVTIISLLAFVGLSKKREFFLVNPLDMAIPFALAITFFIFVMLLAFAVRDHRKDRIAYGICATFNNTSLGTGLAVLYFDEKTIAVMIAALFVWSFLPMFVQPVLKRLPAE